MADNVTGPGASGTLGYQTGAALSSCVCTHSFQNRQVSTKSLLSPCPMRWITTLITGKMILR